VEVTEFDELLLGQKLCKACVLLDGLNRGLPKLGIGRTKAGAGAESDGKQRTKRSERISRSLLLFCSKIVINFDSHWSFSGFSSSHCFI